MGTIKFVHPLAIAIAAAVVGPPKFAFETSKDSSNVNLNIFPKIKVIIMFAKAMINTNKNNKGAVLIITTSEEGTPITTKKKKIRNVPNSLVPLIFSKYVANNNTEKTVKVINIKY